MWNHMSEWGWGWMTFGALHMVWFWALVIGAVVLLVRAISRSDRNSVDPLAILKARYARGEIDKANYKRMRKDLEE